jgi:hypothetical protein
MRLAIATSVLLAACYSPQLERCAVRCTVGGDPCPLDMTCGGDGHCHTAGDTGTCPLDQFMVKVMPAGGGSGIVTATPGINCPPTCSETVNDGTNINLAATATAGSRFAGWGGPCTGVDPCMLLVDGDKQVGANFVLTAAITVEINGTGFGDVYTTAPADLVFDCNTNNAPCTVSYDKGAAITLMEQPDQTSSFIAWGGDCQNATGATCTLTLDGPKTVLAQFN